MIEASLPKITKHQFFFETALYDPILIADFEENIFRGEVDAYSSINYIDTTYTISSSKGVAISDSQVFKTYSPYSQYKGFLELSLSCKRKDNDELVFHILITESYILKIGQFPSLADIQFAELGKKYDRVLPKEDLKNLKKSIGLNAHGAGAGSFVYLRRIFENLIFETFYDNKDWVGLNESEFTGKRMEEKVEVLKSFLPEQLVKMKKIYSILSLGVHELSEEDCLKYFPALKLSIELILDQKIESLKKKKEMMMHRIKLTLFFRN